MFTTILALTGMLSGLGALALGGYALSRTRVADNDSRMIAQRTAEVGASGVDPLAVRDVAVLHYDALEEMSGARSFSLALLNSEGDGVVVTSINGRTETRTYAKPVVGGESDILLSPEEYRVVRSARLGEGIGASMTAGSTPARSAPPAAGTGENGGDGGEWTAHAGAAPSGTAPGTGAARGDGDREPFVTALRPTGRNGQPHPGHGAV
ncbi:MULTISPECIES: DUF4446 family protein [unclassified Nocardiopsis]|uniref:DUF4446 family protein n=1 Tax=unclassified Nocardiopsis TaxID=2649073 RepID=UPI0011610417|nr:DUF4446 family protein [Nocardiopsis sp. TSRI0078]